MEELGDDLTKVERELSDHQASLSESTRMNAKGSGCPVSRRTTLGDKPTDMFENRKPESSTSVSKSDYQNSDRFVYTSTTYIRDREYMHLRTEENITTRHPCGVYL